MTMATQMWVLHSPYPDGTWRGLEKCSHNGNGLILFATEDAAKTAIDDGEGLADGLVPVSVQLHHPPVRGRIDCTDAIEALQAHLNQAQAFLADPTLSTIERINWQSRVRIASRALETLFDERRCTHPVCQGGPCKHPDVGQGGA